MYPALIIAFLAAAVAALTMKVLRLAAAHARLRADHTYALGESTRRLSRLESRDHAQRHRSHGYEMPQRRPQG